MDHIVLTVLVGAMSALGLTLVVNALRRIQAQPAMVRPRPILAPPAEAVPANLFAARRR